jgi:hypothetical protein
MRPDRRPSWRTVNDLALADPAGLARVLASMFDLYCGSVRRGSIRWWQPDYLPAPAAAAVAEWLPPRAADVRDQCIEDFIASRRAVLAPVNRALRDSEVHLACSRPERRLFLIDSYQGEWRAASGAQRGNDLLSLGMLRWGCSYGQAGNRIAKLMGFRVPTIVRAAHAT